MRILPLLLAAFVALFAFASPLRAHAQEDAPAPSASAAQGEVKDAAVASADEKKPEDKPALARFNGWMFEHLFFDVAFGKIQVDEVDRTGKPVLDDKGVQKKKKVGIPFLVVVLVLGAMFFTFWFRFINIRGFKHAIDVVRGIYDDPDDKGEISHFRALTSALSATVGLGNIAGVAVAIVKGGPGAVVWMMIVAVFGMTAKFSSCTLAQLFRQENKDGSISGGPMYYLDLGLKQYGPAMGYFGKGLAWIYAVMIMGGAIGGGNMFQANQTAEALTTSFDLGYHKLNSFEWGVGLDGENVSLIVEIAKAKTSFEPDYTSTLIIGIVMAVLVAAVILGGIKRIGAATSKIVPAMVGIYVVASLFVIISNIGQLPEAIGLMLSMAFNKNAFFGGMMGVLVIGVQRAAFSNEAGLGSAAVAHAAAKTDEPVREGMVAMLGPFIDTIVVCFMTAMVVIITGQWSAEGAGELQGAAVTARAFGTTLSWFPVVLSISIVLFAYSTMISWCYYGERGWIYLLDHFDGWGLRSVIVFRLFFVLAVVYGAVNTLQHVLDFSDIMILSMAFPNIIGSVILAPKVLPKLADYWDRYRSGDMKTYDQLKAAGATKADVPT